MKLSEQIIALLKKPDASFPLFLGMTSLLIFLLYLWLFFPVETISEDENTPARLFQLLVVIQFFAMIYFFAKRLSQYGRTVFFVLMIQILPVVCTVGLIIYFER